MKEDFTTVLQCNFNLAHAVFLEGTTGYNLDVMARMPAWRRGINFNHGTGHDVGYLMNIHEASCGFRCAIREKEQAPLMDGLVITTWYLYRRQPRSPYRERTSGKKRS